MKLIPLIIALLIAATPLHAANLSITWTPNTETDLAGYGVYMDGVR